MSEGVEAEQLYSAVEESARLVGATFSRDKVWPIMDAYRGVLTAGRIVFSVQVAKGHTGEFEYTVQVAPGTEDPYTRAVANGFLPGTDQPIGSLLADIQARIPVDEFFIDCGIDGGFKKVYALPSGLQEMSTLADIPSMPRALTENADFFARYGLEEAALIGIDYQHRTMNVYFQVDPRIAGNLDPETVLSMLREIGLPEPDEGMLELACKAYRIYTTLSWDTSQIQRISFAPLPHRQVDLSALPVPLEPGIEKFMTGAPHTYDGGRISASTVKWSHEGEFLDLGSYYQISPAQLKAMTPMMAAQEG